MHASLQTERRLEASQQVLPIMPYFQRHSTQPEEGRLAGWKTTSFLRTDADADRGMGYSKK